MITRIGMIEKNSVWGRVEIYHSQKTHDVFFECGFIDTDIVCKKSLLYIQ